MGSLTLSDLAAEMGRIDFTLLSTRTEGGWIAGRPMSNNGEVDHAGDSYFFSHGETRTVSDIESDPRVSLGLQGRGKETGAPGTFIAVQGRAELLRDRAAFEAHWNPDLARWFDEGIDTPGLVLIKVTATRIHYWTEEGEGELTP